MAKKKLSHNKELFSLAKEYLVGGVDSPVRSFKYTGMDPVPIKRGKGPYIYDYDANRYIDYVLGWGAMILGHAHPQVISEIKAALDRGLTFGATHDSEIALARLIRRAIPFAEKIRFVNSGTEAVITAVRLARAFSKRDKIIKFSRSYHGHADYLLAKAGSGLATLGIPASEGVPKEFLKQTLVLASGDIDLLRKTFQKYPGQIAAVLVEPVGANYGVLPPDAKFLWELRRLTSVYDTVLIFDEIVTAFRFGFRTVAQKIGIVPDLICLGKIIGGGLPIGACAGKKEIMEHLAPLGKVYQASTFSGNPVVMQAGLTTLEVLEKNQERYAELSELTGHLTRQIEEKAKDYQAGLSISSYENIFSLRFKDKEQFPKFFREVLKRGIYFAPSEYEANFISFAHGHEEIDKTITAATQALRRL